MESNFEPEKEGFFWKIYPTFHLHSFLRVFLANIYLVLCLLVFSNGFHFCFRNNTAAILCFFMWQAVVLHMHAGDDIIVAVPQCALGVRSPQSHCKWSFCL